MQLAGWMTGGIAEGIKLREVCVTLLAANPLVDQHPQMKFELVPSLSEGLAKREVLQQLSEAVTVRMPGIRVPEQEAEKRLILVAEIRILSPFPATLTPTMRFTLGVANLVLT